jgi:chaperonin GroES
MNWKPIGDQVLLKVEKVSEKTKSGIILVDREMQFIKGEVIATGDGLFTQTGHRIPMTVEPGDSVYVYKANLGENKDIMLNDENYVIIRESEIAVVNKPEKEQAELPF